MEKKGVSRSDLGKLSAVSFVLILVVIGLTIPYNSVRVSASWSTPSIDPNTHINEINLENATGFELGSFDNLDTSVNVREDIMGSIQIIAHIGYVMETYIDDNITDFDSWTRISCSITCIDNSTVTNFGYASFEGYTDSGSEYYVSYQFEPLNYPLYDGNYVLTIIWQFKLMGA